MPVTETSRRLERLAALGVMMLAAAASIATSKPMGPVVRGFGVSTSFELTAEHPVATFNVTVDMNAAASDTSSGARRTLSVIPDLFATTDGGAEVTITLSPGTQSETVVLRGRDAPIVNIEAAQAFFAGCRDREPCVRQATVRFELRSGAGASCSFAAHAEVSGWSSEPPTSADIKVTIAETMP